MALLKVQRRREVNKVVSVRMSNTRGTGVEEGKKNVENCNKNKGGGGISLANSPLGVKRFTYRTKHGTRFHIGSSSDMGLLIWGADEDTACLIQT